MEEIKPDNPICPYCGNVTLAFVSLENEWTCKKCKNWYKNSQLVKQEFTTHYLVPCHDSEFHGIECLETEKQFGFMKNPCDHRPAHQLWIDKEDVETLIKLFYQKFAENVRAKGYDFNYNFEELNNRKKIEIKSNQGNIRTCPKCQGRMEWVDLGGSEGSGYSCDDCDAFLDENLEEFKDEDDIHTKIEKEVYK